MKLILAIVLITGCMATQCPIFKCSSPAALRGETCSTLSKDYFGLDIWKCANSEDWCYSFLFNATFDSEANIFLNLFGTC